ASRPTLAEMLRPMKNVDARGYAGVSKLLRVGIMRARFFFHLLASVNLALCSAAYGADSQSPGRLDTGAVAVDLSGDWTGYWADSKSGHTGPLRATFCQCDPDHYRVTFRGRFFKVFPFRYRVVLTVSGREGNRLQLTGEQNLGPLFGSFFYSAD